MRVISQDGKIDIPYEGFAFSILDSGGGNYGIVAVKNVAEPPVTFMNSIIATYSAEAKAIKTMRMLREVYRFYNDADNGIFCFPQDNEIEV
mgnify:CR=1 FL=1